MRLTYNTCILGSWILYIMLGTVLVIIALKTPGELKKYSEDGKVDSLSPEYKFLAGPVSELDSQIIDGPSRFMCSYFCPCEEKYSQPWNLETSEKELKTYKRTKVEGTVGIYDFKDDQGNYRLKFET